MSNPRPSVRDTYTPNSTVDPYLDYSRFDLSKIPDIYLSVELTYGHHENCNCEPVGSFDALDTPVSTALDPLRRPNPGGGCDIDPNEVRTSGQCSHDCRMLDWKVTPDESEWTPGTPITIHITARLLLHDAIGWLTRTRHDHSGGIQVRHLRNRSILRQILATVQYRTDVCSGSFINPDRHYGMIDAVLSMSIRQTVFDVNTELEMPLSPERLTPASTEFKNGIIGKIKNTTIYYVSSVLPDNGRPAPAFIVDTVYKGAWPGAQPVPGGFSVRDLSTVD